MSAPYTLHLDPYTLHLDPCTLHPELYTLSLDVRALHPKGRGLHRGPGQRWTTPTRARAPLSPSTSAAPC